MTFDNKRELNTLRFFAGITGFIGMAGLLALLAQDAFAADGNQGLQPGARPFTNPFANTPGGRGAAPPAGDPFFDDEEEDDDFDFPAGGGGMAPPPAPPPSMGGSGGGARAADRPAPSFSAGGAPSSANGPDPKFVPGGVSVGGGPNAGVIEHNAQAAIKVDDETGEGSKAVVTDFNYPDADIMDIAKTLGRLTGKNFIIDKDVKGRITIISNSPITVGDAWKAFLTALDMNNFALIPSGKYIRIARQRDARDKQLKTYTGDFSPDTDALITRVFPLKYINAEEVARTFRSFMPANSRIIPYEQTNTVIVTDTGSNIAKLNKMLELLDVEGYDAGIEVITVKYASAAELSKLIDTLVPGTGAGGPGGAPGAPRFGGGAGRFASRRTKEGGIINTIISDDRTNTLIVHANTKGADQVRELVAKLDQKQPAVTGGGKVHVVYLQFADAETMANTLNNISQGSGTGFRPVSTAPGGGGTGVNPVANSLFEGSIKISADKSTNSLVVTASPADFVTVQRVINRLDIPRDEVYVECIVMEVTLQRSSAYSANVVSLPSGVGSLPNGDLLGFLTNPAAATGAILGFKAGTTSNFDVGGGKTIQVSSVQGLIKALQSYAKTNVLATPQIIALDNTEANFISAEKIPVPTTTQVANVGLQTSFVKESIELSIKIKPQINKLSNFVKLETEIKIGDVTAAAGNSGGVGIFNTLDRSAKTTVVVGDSDTIVIGGLIRDKIQESVSKIPLLGDIPVLGWLFKSKETSIQKTNLLVFMTPHIVRQYEKVRAVLDKKLKERDEFLEAEANGDDPMRSTRDRIIRNLPDINELSKSKPTRSFSLADEEDGKPAALEVTPGDDTPRRDKTSGGNHAPLVAPETGGAELKVPSPQDSANTSSLPPGADPTISPAPPMPAPGDQPATPPQPGNGT
jgi:general secretion pathway protein D